MIPCHDKREYMTLGEYMEKYPIAYAEAVDSMTAEQKALFAARFEDRYIYLPKDETSDTGEIFSISANVTNVTPNADNPESISAGGTAYWKYTVDGDAEAPIVAVAGCEWVAPAEGMIFLFNPTGNITITVSASLKSYAVTTQGVNCTFTPSTGTIQARGTLQVFINAAQNYKWNGTATVTGATAVKNISGGYITLSNPTGPVNVSATCNRIIYPVTLSGTHCTHTPNPTQIAAGATLAITYTAAAGYDLPDASGVTVSGCSFGWKNSTGILTLYNPTGAVSASVVAVAKSYAITATVANGNATGANVIHTGETVALTIAANEGYNLPDTVTVTGASQTWNKETGTLTLSNPTGAVTVSAVCEAVQTGETWILNDTINQYSGETTGSLGRRVDYLSVEFVTNGYTVKSLIFDGFGSYTSTGGWGIGIQSISVPSSASGTVFMYEDGGGWTNTAFKTWVFSVPPAGDLLTWLQANGTKQ